jgi:hypothetical protein
MPTLACAPHPLAVTVVTDHPAAPFDVLLRSTVTQASGSSFAGFAAVDDTAPDPTVSISISLHASVIAAVRARVGRRGVSAYVERAVLRQIRRDNLRELVEANEAIHGPLTSEDIQAARERFYRPSDQADRP